MDNLRNNGKIILFCVILVLLAIFLYYLSVINNRENGEILKESIDVEVKHYEANEYIPVHMTEDQIVRKYLIDYKNLMINDVEEAYNTLNDEYRQLKYNDINEFISYVENIKSVSLYSLDVDKYEKRNVNGYKYFDILATDGNRYIFKEISIMDYEVFLDNYTMEIK